MVIKIDLSKPYEKYVGSIWDSLCYIYGLVF